MRIIPPGPPGGGIRGGGSPPFPPGNLLNGAPTTCNTCSGSGSGSGGSGSNGGSLIFKPLASGTSTACQTGNPPGPPEEQSGPCEASNPSEGGGPGVTISFGINFALLPAEATIIGAKGEYVCPVGSATITDDSGAGGAMWTPAFIAQLNAMLIGGGSYQVTAMATWTPNPPTSTLSLQHFILYWIVPKPSYE